MKNSIALLCVLMLAAALFAGCTKSDKGTAQDPGSSTPSASAGNDTPLPMNQISKEKITLTAFAAPYPEVKLFDFEADKNAFTKWLEEQTNIQLKWVMAPSAGEVSQKLSMMIGSGDVPDIMFLNGFTPSVQEIYGAQGLLLPLNDYIDKYGKWTKKMFEEMPEIKKAVSLNGGKIYAMPSYAEDTHLRSFYKMWVYKPWLDKLNLPVPTTTEQFYEMLKAFKERDPNGNKIQDEIPMLGNTAWVSWNPLTYLMNSFVYYDSERKLIMNNGKVEPVFTKPEFKEGLKYIARLVADGLLSPETFTMDLSQFKQAVENPDVPLVGTMPSHAPFVVADTRYRDYVPIAPLKGPQNVQYANYHYTTNNMGAVISATSKHKEEAFKLLDFLYSPEATIRSTIGRQGKEWDYAKEGDRLGRDGKPAKFIRMNQGNAYDQNSGEKNVNWYMIGNYYNPNTLQDSFAVDDKADADNPGKVLMESTLKQYIPYQPDPAMLLPQTIVFTEEESALVTDIEITVSDYVTETMSQFILGMKDIDAGWDNYLKELDGMGLSQLIQTYQNFIDRNKT